MNKHPKEESIRNRLNYSYRFIICLLTVPTALLLIFLLTTTTRYYRHISYITDARTVINLSDSALMSELWDIVAGIQDYDLGLQQDIMSNIKSHLDLLSYETETYESQQQVQAAAELVETLNTYIDQLDAPSYRYSVTSSAEQTLREIRSIADLLHTVLQEYIFIEIGVISDINGQMRTASLIIALLTALLMVTIFAAVRESRRTLERQIQTPIHELEVLSVKLAGGDLAARAVPPAVTELVTLTNSLNTMADQLGELIETRVANQRNLRKAELRTLQAQITPHFIYNTLDTIVWLAQQKDNEAVVDITMALTQFFRISLSGGKDYITVDREISHVESYLKIQAVRYASIMQYQIDIDDKLRQHQILKLLLQPLVENAIYHGIKKKRGRGLITVTGRLNPDQTMTFSVSDTGMGMTEERLREIRTALASDHAPNTGFGLYNVNQRIQLYYDNPGLNIESTYQKGTTISFTIPCTIE